jgi:ADP-heptose:LPS heptosyltransferase
MKETSRLLVCRLRALGDVIRTLPAIAGLRRALPDAQIDFVCFEEAADAVALVGDVDNVIALPRLSRSNAHPSDLCRVDLSPWAGVLSHLRSNQYDLYFDLHGIFYSGLLGLLAGIPARYGFERAWVKEGSELCYTNRVPLEPAQVNRFDRHCALLKARFAHVRQSVPRLKIATTPELRGRDYILIYPGSSGVGVLKRWPAHKYGQLSQQLAENVKLPVIVAWGPGEEEVAMRVCDTSGGTARMAIATSVSGLFGLVAGASAVVGNDGACMHVASVLLKPSVVIFGPTDPKINSPWSAGKSKIVYKGVDCSPCPCWEYHCPYAHRCMGAVSVDDVLGAFLELWGAVA